MNKNDRLSDLEEKILIISLRLSVKYDIDVDSIIKLYFKLTELISSDLNYIGLELAFEYHNPSMAIGLLEKEDLVYFAERVILVRYLLGDFIPLYNIDMLEDLIKNYIPNLESNRGFLIEIGLPKNGYERSGWLNSYLSSLYPVRGGIITNISDKNSDNI